MAILFSMPELQKMCLHAMKMQDASKHIDSNNLALAVVTLWDYLPRLLGEFQDITGVVDFGMTDFFNRDVLFAVAETKSGVTVDDGNSLMQEIISTAKRGGTDYEYNMWAMLKPSKLLEILGPIYGLMASYIYSDIKGHENLRASALAENFRNTVDMRPPKHVLLLTEGMTDMRWAIGTDIEYRTRKLA